MRDGRKKEKEDGERREERGGRIEEDFCKRKSRPRDPPHAALLASLYA